MLELRCHPRGSHGVNMGIGDSAELELAFDSSVCNARTGRVIQI